MHRVVGVTPTGALLGALIKRFPDCGCIIWGVPPTLGALLKGVTKKRGGFEKYVMSLSGAPQGLFVLDCFDFYLLEIREIRKHTFGSQKWSKTRSEMHQCIF